MRSVGASALEMREEDRQRLGYLVAERQMIGHKFLFGQSAGFVEEWTRGRELGDVYEQLGKEIKRLTREQRSGRA